MKKMIIRSMILLSSLSILLGAKVSAQSYLLGMVEVSFCNYNVERRELDLTTKGGEQLPICIQFTNTSTSPTHINGEFLDSVITADSSKDRDCNASDRPKTQFGNFMLPYETEILLPPQQTIQKEYTISYPAGFSGLSHGCFAYHIIGSDITSNDMFTIRIRSIKYIDVFVSELKAKQTIKISQNPIITKSNDEYSISFGIQNKGNVPEKIHISSLLSNIFGYQKEFTFDVTLPANEETQLTTQSFIMPIYGGPYLLSSKIDYTPEFNFNITNGAQPSEIYAGGTKTTQTLLFVWTRQSWLTIIIIASIVFGIFFKKKEKGLKHKYPRP